MPRVRSDCGALGLSAEAIYVPKEEFFNDNYCNENGQREWCRSVMGRQNFANAFDGETSCGRFLEELPSRDGSCLCLFGNTVYPALRARGA